VKVKTVVDATELMKDLTRGVYAVLTEAYSEPPKRQ
jgi:hypothetical protein